MDGVFTSTLFPGAAAGALLGNLLLGGGTVLGAVTGMSCLLAVVTHAPLIAASRKQGLPATERFVPAAGPSGLSQLARRLRRGALRHHQPIPRLTGRGGG